MDDLTAKELYALKLHETKAVRPGYVVMRVPGGWIYESWEHNEPSAVVFIPWNNEFQPSDYEIR
jgi:hypothetical protein